MSEIISKRVQKVGDKVLMYEINEACETVNQKTFDILSFKEYYGASSEVVLHIIENIQDDVKNYLEI